MLEAVAAAAGRVVLEAGKGVQGVLEVPRQVYQRRAGRYSPSYACRRPKSLANKKFRNLHSSTGT